MEPAQCEALGSCEAVVIGLAQQFILKITDLRFSPEGEYEETRCALLFPLAVFEEVDGPLIGEVAASIFTQPTLI